jgi:hypothetical protein
VRAFLLGRAVGADLRQALEVPLFDRGAVVAATEGPVPYQPLVAPTFSDGNVPDILVLALQAEWWLGPKLLWHGGSLATPGQPPVVGGRDAQPSLHDAGQVTLIGEA